MNDWPGRSAVQASRLWPALETAVARAGELGFDGVIALGSIARGDPDELSDLDLLLVVRKGGFEQAWEERHRLPDDPLLTWEPTGPRDLRIRWLNWLTRDLVKVEAGIVEPEAGDKELAEPFAVLLGDPSLAERFPRISIEEVRERRARRMERQQDADPADLTPGQLIDWRLWELKHAVRAARAQLGRQRAQGANETASISGSSTTRACQKRPPSSER